MVTAPKHGCKYLEHNSDIENNNNEEMAMEQ
jgi:hypothetical protein